MAEMQEKVIARSIAGVKSTIVGPHFRAPPEQVGKEGSKSVRGIEVSWWRSISNFVLALGI